jgi:type IV pilus assembly protein PilV
MLNYSPRRARSAQTGSSLIEVLIAILIFGLGMLGMVGLMAATAKYQSGNQARVQISNTIENIGERIRSNIGQANGYLAPGNPIASTGYTYSATFAAQQAVTLASLWPVPASSDCMLVDCTAAQREAYDMRVWRAQLKQSMPGGSGIITGNVLNGFDVTVMWFDKTAVTGNDTLFTDTDQTSLTCSVPAAAASSPASRFCCPQVAGVSATGGVRCYNTKIIP